MEGIPLGDLLHRNPTGVSSLQQVPQSRTVTEQARSAVQRVPEPPGFSVVLPRFHPPGFREIHLEHALHLRCERLIGNRSRDLEIEPEGPVVKMAVPMV